MPSTVQMASPEYHGLLAHHYIPRETAQIGMDCVMQEDGDAQPQLRHDTKLAQ